MKRIFIAGMALLLLGGPVAQAQEPDHHGIRLAQEENRDRDRDRDHEVRGNPHWGKGDRVPAEYRAERTYVQDWGAMHLRRPPRGDHWVRIGDRLLLVADRTGLVIDVHEGR